MFWYIVVVFFTAGLNGPAHFEENWHPKLVDGQMDECIVAGNNVLRYLNSRQANLKDEQFQVSCILADDMEDLVSIIQNQWTFEDAPIPGSYQISI